jgi:hypothetical protein
VLTSSFKYFLRPLMKWTWEPPMESWYWKQDRITSWLQEDAVTETTATTAAVTNLKAETKKQHADDNN